MESMVLEVALYNNFYDINSLVSIIFEFPASG